MAEYLVKGSITEVSEAVRCHLQSERFDIRWQQESPYLVWGVKGRLPGMQLVMRVRMKPCGEALIVNAHCQHGWLRRVVVLLFAMCLSADLVILAINAEQLLKALGRVMTLLSLFLLVVSRTISPMIVSFGLSPFDIVLIGGFILAFPLLYRTSRFEEWAVADLASIETDLWESLRTRFRLRPRALSEFRTISGKGAINVFVPMFLAAQILLYQVHPLAPLCTLPYCGLLALFVFLAFICHREPALSAQCLCARNVVRTTLLRCQILLLICFGWGLTIGYHLGHQPPRSSTSLPAQPTLKMFGETAVSFGDTTDDPRMRMSLIREDTIFWAQQIARKLPSISNRLGFVSNVFIAITGAVIAVALIVLMRVVVAMAKEIAEFPEYWRQYVGRREPDWVRLSVSGMGSPPVWFKIMIIIIYVFGMLLNIAALLVSLDGISFAITGHTVLCKSIGGFLAWFAVPFLTIGMITGTENASVWITLFRLGLGMFVALPALFYVRLVTGVAIRAINRITSRMRGVFQRNRIPSAVKTFVLNTCVDHALACPRMRVFPSRALQVAIAPSFMGDRCIINVSSAALSRFTEAELKAALAHELGHVRQGLRRLRMLSSLCILGGHPPWLLALMFNLQELEERADQFALQAGAAPQALVGAILKTTDPPLQLARWFHRGLMRLRNHIPGRMHRWMFRAVQWFLIMDRFLFTGELTAFAHPPLRDRMTTILAHKELHQNTLPSSLTQVDPK